METVSFNVPSIVCNTCATKIQEELRDKKWIHNIKIDNKSQNVSVEYDPYEISPEEIGVAITSLGYEVNS